MDRVFTVKQMSMAHILEEMPLEQSEERKGPGSPEGSRYVEQLNGVYSPSLPFLGL